MSDALKVHKIGNSLGVVLPFSTLKDLSVEEGDDLFAIQTPDGIQLTPYDPEFAETMEDAREFMHTRQNAFRELSWDVMATPRSDEPAWCSEKLVLALHAEVIQQFRGTTGLRDEERLESALDRPHNRYAGIRFSLNWRPRIATALFGITPSSTKTNGQDCWRPGRSYSGMDIDSTPTRPTWSGSWNEWPRER